MVSGSFFKLRKFFPIRLKLTKARIFLPEIQFGWIWLHKNFSGQNFKFLSCQCPRHEIKFNDSLPEGWFWCGEEELLCIYLWGNLSQPATVLLISPKYKLFSFFGFWILMQFGETFKNFARCCVNRQDRSDGTFFFKWNDILMPGFVWACRF